jgi:hypothetical protein
MFIKRKITGLNPNSSYQMRVEISFASNAPTNAVGVGGAPGEGVVLKVGATIVEPLKIVSAIPGDNSYRMNINKGAQRNPGPDMDTIGHIGVSDTTRAYTLINRSNAGHLFNFTTDSNGDLWVCIGTESGFEAKTTLYYNQITLTFTSLLGSEDPKLSHKISIYPNPTSESIKVKSNLALLGQSFTILDLFGIPRMEGILTSEISTINLNELSTGMYFLKIGDYRKQAFNVIKK